MAASPDLLEFLLRTGDNCLILSHRLSEWCGHGPTLEEDIALANTALDLLGQARLWLTLAGEVEGQDRDEDALAMFRDVWDFRNALLVEQPNGDFAQTLVRQFLFDQYHVLFLTAVSGSRDPRVADIAAKALKEARYHADRSAELTCALGDGTAESHQRMQTALAQLYPYVGELFAADTTDRALAAAGMAPDLGALRADFDARVQRLCSAARLDLPRDRFFHQGGRTGQRHSEHLGHLLATMQWTQRAYPGAQW